MCIRDRDRTHPFYNRAVSHYKDSAVGKSFDESHAPGIRSEKASLWQQFKEATSVVHDDHSWAMAFLRESILGGTVGAFYGISFNLWMNYYPDFQWQKGLSWAKKQNFGTFKLALKVAAPFAFIGAGLGMFRYFYFEIFWPRETSHLPPQVYGLLSTGLFGSILSSTFLGIRRYPLGFLIGGSLGLLYTELSLSNSGLQRRSTVGFKVELPNLTEEERQKQLFKDVIQYYGTLPVIRDGYVRSLEA
eukprot:TRINITY_DN1874_c0_g1_i2.p1 TRINITY_DN1874_c0_g1~~TRINITY_DN1874_c0_g1_i2.p1  ORF type:complete len:246 (-),score=31.47 TRINITY_DN1874_c0_g1_i2:95-832(-)